MVPRVGRIVHYKLTSYDADAINQRRDDARRSRVAHEQLGTIVHVGNRVAEGEEYPMLIVRLEMTGVQGQVFLDGNDTYWATSRRQGVDLGQWHEPEHGQ